MMFLFGKKTKKPRFNLEKNIIKKEISRSKRFGYQFGILVVEVPHTVPRGLSRLLPGHTISFHLLERHIRSYDTIISSMHRRYYLILPQTARQGVEAVKLRIKNLAEKYAWGDLTFDSAVYPDDGESADVLLKRIAVRS